MEGSYLSIMSMALLLKTLTHLHDDALPLSGHLEVLLATGY